jgi:hypothetical protein
MEVVGATARALRDKEGIGVILLAYPAYLMLQDVVSLVPADALPVARAARPLAFEGVFEAVGVVMYLLGAKGLAAKRAM